VKQPVLAVEKSRNAKIGPVACTYVSQVTCPGADPSDPHRCPLLGSGCYAETGPASWHISKVSEGDRNAIARMEANAIDNLPSPKVRRHLRLHVVGDSPTDDSARIVSAAAERYMERANGGRAWTYSHAWRTVDRSSWGRVAVRASCESLQQVGQAIARGYATALLVDRHDSPSQKVNVGGRTLRQIACPTQTGSAGSCVECRLCWTAGRDVVIAFAAHGNDKRKAAELVQIGGLS